MRRINGVGVTGAALGSSPPILAAEATMWVSRTNGGSPSLSSSSSGSDSGRSAYRVCIETRSGRGTPWKAPGAVWGRSRGCRYFFDGACFRSRVAVAPPSPSRSGVKSYSWSGSALFFSAVTLPYPDDPTSFIIRRDPALIPMAGLNVGWSSRSTAACLACAVRLPYPEDVAILRMRMACLSFESLGRKVAPSSSRSSRVGMFSD
mmetsp:Transcript_6079/g.15528  ORF Transcript_6079/g.15528 Transcript_6079/m.15528 type:complete len:205 (-) Transcript_6079:322-936(-)